MSTGRRGAAIVGAVIAVGVLAGPSIAAQTVHPHDEDAYLEYVRTYVGGWSSSADPYGPQRDEAWVSTHPNELLAAGERACDWLEGQPEAPDVDATGRHDVSALEQMYVGVDADMGLPGIGTPREIGLSGLSTMGRHTVVAGAWGDLCWWTRESRTAPRSPEDD